MVSRPKHHRFVSKSLSKGPNVSVPLFFQNVSLLLFREAEANPILVRSNQSLLKYDLIDVDPKLVIVLVRINVPHWLPVLRV